MTQTTEVYGPINKAVHSADLLGAMSPAAIWALVALCLAGYVYYMAKQNRASDKEWQDIRSKEAIADANMAAAVGRLSETISQVKTIIDERLPRGGNHV